MRKFYFVIIILLAVFITGCRTVAVADIDSIEYTRRIADLERRNADYERRLSEYDSLVGGTVERLEAIRTRANSITDRIDRIIFLFEQYDAEVNRLINAANDNRGTVSQEQTNELLAMVRDYRDVDIKNWANCFGIH